MSPESRLLRLLWVLVLVPLLGVLGLEPPSTPRAADETVYQAPNEPIDVIRPRSGEISQGQTSKRYGTGKTLALVLGGEDARYSLSAAAVRFRRFSDQAHHGGRVVHAWLARGPPSFVTT